jgi:acyl-CoA synthetase (AMP-forming)/AMP-acid ligase II
MNSDLNRLTAAETFVDILCSRAENQPEQLAYRFFPNALDKPLTITYRSLWVEVASLARRFQLAGLNNARILIATTAQQHFTVAFYACLLAGACAVPVPPSGRKRQAERLRLLAEDSQALAIVGDEDDSVSATELAELIKFDSRELFGHLENEALASAWQAPILHADSLALLQYTSGSTGNPKGVMISHGNLMANSASIKTAMSVSENSKVLTTLPLFHDMGLVAGLLQPMYSGCVSNPITPAKFIQQPWIWLRLISDLGITHSGGPNFMFDLAARAITGDYLNGLNLSSWQVAFCGAEPIRAHTVKAFIDKFSDYGFQSGAFYPCYGMAESTLFITGVKPGTGMLLASEQGKSALVNCGIAGSDTQFRIVDPVQCIEVAENIEGEIWVTGPSVAKGYWRRPDLNQDIFQARLVDSDEGPFLRTGDLGICKNGELFVSGRLKDLIILNGKKYAPQDLELEAISSHEALQTDGCVAFNVEGDNTSQLVVIAELRRSWLRRTEDFAAIKKAIGEAVFRAYQLKVNDVILVYPHSVPKTSSGKLRRSQSRSNYLEGSLTSLSEPNPTNFASDSISVEV